MLYLQEINNVKLLKSSLFESLDWLEHSFTTRYTGISPDPYSSFNMYSSDHDEFSNVLKNREILGRALNFKYKDLVLAKQIHGKNVHVVGILDKGNGALSHSQAIDNTDSLITNIPEIPIMLLYADCLPILIADKNKKAVGVIHAGWKGTYQKILIETIEKMIETFDSNIEDLFIAFGIGISKNSFEIGEDVRDKLQKVNHSRISFMEKNGKIYADLIEINKSQALNFGIKEENIDYNKELCTYVDNDLFYSYRRNDKVTGRQGAVIFIKENIL